MVTNKVKRTIKKNVIKNNQITIFRKANKVTEKQYTITKKNYFIYFINNTTNSKYFFNSYFLRFYCFIIKAKNEPIFRKM